MVGGRGMITSARIADLRQLEGMAWITCLRGPAIRKLMDDDGPLQLSRCSTSRTSPRSAPPGATQASGWSPAATRSWPPSAPASGEDLMAATEDDLGKIAVQARGGAAERPGQDRPQGRAGA